MADEAPHQDALLETPASFGELLRRYRLAAGLSQAELAERAGLSTRGISDLERGARKRPFPDTVRRLAASLHLDGPAQQRLLAARGTPILLRPLPAHSSTRHANLPRELTSFIGREHELEELKQLLNESALVTVSGPGGAGKTRLALRLAHQLGEQDIYADGVLVLELAPLTEPHLVVDALSEAIGVPPGAVRLDVVVRYLQARSMLLVLDNCEHLLAACADLTSLLLDSCAGIRLLTTSREPLHLTGEVVFRIPPLGLPRDERLETLRESEAGRLFVQRARAAGTRFVLSELNAPAVSRICRRLDGLPLAIELAAARVTTFSPADIAARLDDALGFAGRGPRNAPPRQQTLEAAMAWSYNLLDDDERAMFRRLSVFAGGFTLDASQAMADPHMDNLAVLARLVARSMVQVEPQSEDAVRYRLLEPLRQFASIQLAAAGELDTAQRRHAAYMRALGERAGPAVDMPRQAARTPELGAETDNIRVAVEWAIEAEDVEVAVRLAAALWMWWTRPDLQWPARVWLGRIMNLPGVEQHAVAYCHVLVGYAIMCKNQGDMALAMRTADEANRLAVALGEGALEALSLSVLGTSLAYQGQPDGEPQLHRALERSRANGMCWNEVQLLCTLGDLALRRGEADIAEASIVEATRLARGLDVWTRGMASNALGDLLRARGEHAAAERAYQAAVELFVSLDPFRRYTPQAMLHNLGFTAMATGEIQRAASLFLESAQAYRVIGYDRRGLTECVVGLACTAVRAGEFLLAGRLFGSAEAAMERLAPVLTPANQADYERGLAALAAGASAAAIEANRALGRTLELERAIDQARSLVLEQSIDRVPALAASPPPTHVDSLTSREREIASLLARGMRNREIADALLITPKTTANHVQRVLDKLGMRSRSEVAARAQELGLRPHTQNVATE